METGFPSPAHGYEGKPIDFNLILIRHPSATYVMEMAGHALESKGICPKDWLIVDRSGKPRPEAVVIAEYQGEYICRVLSKSLGGMKLLGDDVSPIPVDEEVRIIATVSFSIRRL